MVTVAHKGISVRVGDREIAPPATVEVDPGTYTVEARRSQKVIYSRTVAAAVGKTIEVFVDASPEPTAVAAPPMPVRKDPPATGATSGVGALPYVLLATGAAFAGFGVFSYSRADAADEALRTSCETYCDDDLRSRRGRWNVMTVASGVTAVAAVASGVLLLVFRSAPSARAPSIAFFPRERGMFATFTATF